MRSKLAFLCALLLLLCAMPQTTYAEALDHSRWCRISVTLNDPQEHTPVVGAKLALYRIASVDVNTLGNLFYRYTAAYENCGIELYDAELATKLDHYLATNAAPERIAATDASGNVTWDLLATGLYLVRQIEAVDGYSPCKPFLVTLPMKVGDAYQYEVDAAPKTEVEKLISYTIKKVWNIDKTVEVADSVIVQLLKGDVPVETATLNEQNGWEVTFHNLQAGDDYRAEEIDVPKGFTVTYAQDGDTFIITNTPALAQTGQLNWPIPVLAAAGLILMTFGTLILRKERG